MSSMMRFVLLLSFLTHGSSIRSAPQVEDLFSYGFSEPVSDIGLLSSEDFDFLNPDSDQLVGSPEELVFDSADVIISADKTGFNADTYTPWVDILFTDDSLNSVTLQSSCLLEDDVPNDMLRVRDGSSCPAINGEDIIEQPEIFQDAEGWWWRIFPPKEKPPSEKQDVTPLDSFRDMFDGVKMDEECPAEYPIRCCTDRVIGGTYIDEGRPVYYVRPRHCIPSMCPPNPI